MTDVRFDGEIMELLKNLTGKTLESYSCDPFIFAPEVFGNDYCAPGGYQLLEQFTPLSDFIEEREDCDGYEPECSREVLTIK